MNKITILLVASLVTLTGAGVAQDYSLLRDSYAGDLQEADPSQGSVGVIVRFRRSLDESQRRAARQRIGDGRHTKLDPDLDLELVQTDLPPEMVRVRLAKAALYVEPDLAISAAQLPNDPRFAEQYGLRNTGQILGAEPGHPGADIAAVGGWTTSTGDSTFRVAIVDSGIELSHPDLIQNVWVNPGEIPGNGIDDDGNGYVDDVHGYDFVDLDGIPQDRHGHGTHVAGIVGAVGNNGQGVCGVMWRCQLVSVRILNEYGRGRLGAAIAALHYCRHNGIRLTNHSWGLTWHSSQPPQALRDAFAASLPSGALHIASAGNSALDNDGPIANYPASFDLANILSVAATDHRDRLTWFSNFGQQSVDLAAPGLQILSTQLGGGYGLGSGTSQAAPYVSGVAGTLLSRNPAWSYQEARSALLTAVRPTPTLVGRCVSGGVTSLAAAIGVTVPAAPTALSATTISSTSARLVWQDNASDELAYRVARLNPGHDPNDPEAWVNYGGDLPPNTTSIIVDNLTPGFTYRFKVRCRNHVAYSPYSDVATLTHCTAPNAPGGCSAQQLGNGHVRVTWSPSGAHVAGYRVARLDPGEDPNNAALWDNVGGMLSAHATDFHDTSVAALGLFRYKVRAVNLCGTYSEYSNVASVTVQCGAPLAPINLTVTWTDWRSVALTWQDRANDEVEYRVAILDPHEDPNNFAQWDGVGGALPPNTTSFVATGLFAGSVYRFRVRCRNACGTFSDFSAIIAGATAGLPAPTGFTANRISSTPALDVRCSWNAYPAGTGYHGVRVARLAPGADPNSPAAWNNVLVVQAPATSGVDVVPSSGSWRYKCRAYVDTPWGRIFSPYSDVNTANP